MIEISELGTCSSGIGVNVEKVLSFCQSEREVNELKPVSSPKNIIAVFESNRVVTYLIE